MTTNEKVRQWSNDRNIPQGGTVAGQFTKLIEEVEELYVALKGQDVINQTETQAIVNFATAMAYRIKTNGNVVQTIHNEKDAIGDIRVVLEIMSQMRGYTVDECYEQAYEEIKVRKGKMIDGVFVKENK